MKRIFAFIFFACIINKVAYTQAGVGFGTSNPQSMVSVQKGLVVAQDDSAGATFDTSRALRFGFNSRTGIQGNRTDRSLGLYTNATRRVIVGPTGLVGINRDPVNFFLEVGGTVYATSNLRTENSVYAANDVNATNGNVYAGNDVIANDVVRAYNTMTADNTITSINGNIVAANGQLQAGGKGVMMTNNSSRLKYVNLSATLSVNNLAVGSSVVGHITISANTFTSAPSAYVGNVITPNGDYFKASIVLENVTATGIDVRVVNLSNAAISFTNAVWRVVAVGPY